MPPFIVEWLTSRTLSLETIERFGLYWNGTKIVIPVFDAEGKFLFNKYRRSPAEQNITIPKYQYDPGSTVVLYNEKTLLEAKFHHLGWGQLKWFQALGGTYLIGVSRSSKRVLDSVSTVAVDSSERATVFPNSRSQETQEVPLTSLTSSYSLTNLPSCSWQLGHSISLTPGLSP